MQTSSDIPAVTEAKAAPVHVWIPSMSMQSALRSLRDANENLRQAMAQTESAWNETAVKKVLSLSKLDVESGATILTFVLLAHRLHYAAATPEGTTLSRRLRIGEELRSLPEGIRWTSELLLSPKLPLLVENVIQEIMRIIASLDLTKLRQESRSQQAVDDLFTLIAQEWLGEKHSMLALPLAAFVAQAAQTLLKADIREGSGLTEETIHATVPWCGIGESLTELLRTAANAALSSGTNPQSLRRSLLTRIQGMEPNTVLRSIANLRTGLLFQEFRMPIESGDPSPWREGMMETHEGETTLIVATLPHVHDASLQTPAAEKLIQSYSLPLKKSGMDLDAQTTPEIMALAEIHATLKNAERGLAIVVAPRWFLHSHRALGVRECLLEDFEQIHIFDLHGDGLASDDESVTDSEGTCLLVLSRNAVLRQWTYYASLSGSRLHKLHALQMKDWEDIEWVRIAPEKPGYLFVPR